VYRAVLFLILLTSLPPWGTGATVSGKIVVSKKASRKTLAPVAYDLRGMAVPDGPPGSEPASQFEKVAIWLEPAVPVPAAPLTIAMKQQNRRFDPGLLIVPVGSTIEFPNWDPIFHNVFSLSRAQPFDLGYYADRKSKSVVFTRPGIVQVYCHLHPSMYGVVVVTTTPWAGKPSGDGTYSWTDVPAGHYDLMVWQRVAGLIRKKVVVAETGIAHVDFQIPLDEAEK
jgi:plastocyanin